jgi:hypothetical protein
MWSSEAKERRLKDESLLSIFYRFVARIAEMEQPLNEADFKRAMKRFGGDKTRVSNEFMTEPENYGPSLVLHSDEPPFDTYRLLKTGSAKFVYSLMAAIFILLSVVFGAAARSWACYDEDYSVIPQGFLLLSGSRSFTVTQDACVWIETFATLIGTYFALPCFGAIVLVRILAPTHKSLRISQRALLTKRDGKPVVMIRLMNSNGGVYTNLECHMWVVVRKSDTETGEGYGEYYRLPLNCPEILDTAQNVTHKVEDKNSFLVENDVIVFDEKGVPRWNRSKLVRVRIIASANSSWGTDHIVAVKSWFDMETHLVDAREDGALPTWKSAMVHFPGEFVKKDGKVTNTLDLGMLSEFEYRETPTMKKEKERLAAAGAAEEAGK